MGAPASKCNNISPDSLANESPAEERANQSNVASIPRNLELSLSGLSADEKARLPSVGSALHGSGICKPCAFFWKSESCSNGVDCFHCHMCPKGEMRRRKKEKRDAMRKATSSSINSVSKHEMFSESDVDDV